MATTWTLSPATTAKWYVRLFPSLNDVAFLLPIFALFARMNGTQLLFSDGDTGWHIRTGEWILKHHAVPTVDLFSFTKSTQPWFAWEWGWDLLAAVIYHFSGLSGLGFVTTVILGMFALLTYRLALQVSQNNVTSMAITAIVCAASSIHWLARPHLVSWIFTLIFLSALEQERLTGSKSIKRMLLVLPALMALWTNLHGGFVAGILIVLCYALGESSKIALAARWNFRSPQIGSTFRSVWSSSSLYWQALLLCSLATLANPYGWFLHQHIYAFLNDSELLDKIQEFQSISFHAGPALFFEILLLLAVLAVFQNLQMQEYTPVLLICIWAHFALQSARHIPLFAVISATFAAPVLSTGLVKARQIPALVGLAETFSDICQDLRSIELTPRVHLISAVALVSIAGLFAAGKKPFDPSFNRDNFPLQIMSLIENRPASHIFTSDQWGDYLLYRLYPRRVFFDGRSDFYGNDFVKVNQRIAAAEHDWKSLLERFDVDLVVLKPETPLSAVLKLTPGSKVIFDDGKVIVFDTSRIYQMSFQKVSGNGKGAERVPSLSQGSNLHYERLHGPQIKQYGKEKRHDDINAA